MRCSPGSLITVEFRSPPGVRLPVQLNNAGTPDYNIAIGVEPRGLSGLFEERVESAYSISAGPESTPGHLDDVLQLISQ